MTEEATTLHPNRPRWLRIYLVPLVTGLTGALLYPNASGTSLTMTLYVAMSLALAAMSGLLLGTANHWARFLIAPFIVVLAGMSLGFSSSLNRIEWIGAIIAALITVVIFVTLEISKWIAGKFRVPDPDAKFEEAFQFSISQMMIVTAATAIFISSIQWLIGFLDQGSIGFPPDGIVIVAIFVGTHVVFTLANLWALMGTRVRYRLGVATALSFISMASALFYRTLGQNMPWVWISVFFVSWLAVVIQLIVLRLEGIRFVRHRA